jgi:hypothetical protein
MLSGTPETHHAGGTHPALERVGCFQGLHANERRRIRPRRDSPRELLPGNPGRLRPARSPACYGSHPNTRLRRNRWNVSAHGRSWGHHLRGLPLLDCLSIRNHARSSALSKVVCQAAWADPSVLAGDGDAAGSPAQRGSDPAGSFDSAQDGIPPLRSDAAARCRCRDARREAA